MHENNKTIVVFGSSAPQPDSPKYLQAHELGKALGQASYTLANGGYGGTMAAAAQGAKQAGSTTIGVTCTAFGRSKPNPWIDKEIKTDNLNERLDTLVNLADAYVLLPGSTGTLLELALVWELINKRFLPQRPIICLSGYWKPVIDTIVNAGETDGACIKFVDSLDTLLQILNDYFADL